MFKRIEGTLENGNPRTLFRALALNAAQFQIVQDIVKFCEGETTLTRKQLMDAHFALRGKIYMPYFIGKNMACKTKTNGIFDVSRLKLAANANAAAPKKAKKAAKKVAKKEANAKKGSKVPVVVETEIKELAESVKNGEVSFTNAVAGLLA